MVALDGEHCMTEVSETEAMAAAVRSTTLSINIRGATGVNASNVNGNYDPTDQLSGGMPLYRKRGDADKWIEYMPGNRQWIVKPTSDRGKNSGWAYAACESGAVVAPQRVRSGWQVSDGSSYHAQPSVQVTVLVEATVAGVVAKGVGSGGGSTVGVVVGVARPPGPAAAASAPVVGSVVSVVRGNKP